MRKRFFSVLLVLVLALSSLVGCGESKADQSSQEEEQQDQIEETEEQEEIEDSRSEEDFKQQYDLIMVAIDELNAYADYVGTVHSIIWNSVGVNEVAKYVGYVRQYYNDDSKESLICKAFGVSVLNSTEKKKAYGYAADYVSSLEGLEERSQEIDDMYAELNKTYGNDYNISDLKDYYIEVSTYVDFAKELEGSYITYNQTLKEYQTNIERLKKAAEIAY